jgi:hypothetical protein
MKRTLLTMSIACILSSCGGSAQNKAIEDQKEAQKVIEASEPGHIPAKEGEWTMTAKIDGKEWTASSFFPLDFQGKIHGFYKEESISLPYDRSYIKVGKKIQFGEIYVALLFTDDAIWDAKNGGMEITKVENDWAEGKFFFTATTSTTGKTKEVTDGFFRISMAKE